MDNISHSVAGLLAGEIIHRSLPNESTPERNALRRRLILVSCWIASNFPDLDLILTPLLPQPLGYLLHHRGHTHTILYALPQALLLFASIWMIWGSARRLLKSDDARHVRRGLAISITVGFSLHLLMDFLNSYGIHPFHPIDSHWYFGDMVFIVEPLFWVAFGIPMLMTLTRKWLKLALTACLMGTCLLFTLKGFLPWFSFAALTAIAAGLGTFQLKCGSKRSSALILAAFIGLVFVGIQSFASGQAKRAVRIALANQDSSSRFLDSAMSSYPTNPLCWGFVSVETNEGSNFYRLRKGLLSLAPEIMPVEACPALLSKNEPNPLHVGDSIALFSETKGDLAKFRTLQEQNCHFNAWLRFARIPYVDDRHAYDARFEPRGPRGNFSTLTFADFAQRECSNWIPQWRQPREDMLATDQSPSTTKEVR